VFNVPDRFQAFFRLLSDMIIPLYLYFKGIKKMYLMGNFFIGYYPGKIIWNLTNIEPFVRDSNIKYSIKHRFRLNLLKALFYISNKPDCIVSQSKSTKELLQSFKIFDGIHISHIYNGVSEFDGLVAGTSSQRIVFVGQLVRYKRLELIIEQLFKVGAFNTYSLDVIGQLDWDIEYVNGIKCLIKDLKITDKVIFHGELKPNEVHDFYVNSSFMVYASLYDNCPNNVLEALNLKLPILAWENTILKELHIFGGIVLVDETLSSKDVTMLNDDLRKCSFTFSWSDHVSKLINIMEKL
ncbi:glycosyltransferase family 4 protein, partial [Vibrio lentus]